MPEFATPAKIKSSRIKRSSSISVSAVLNGSSGCGSAMLDLSLAFHRVSLCSRNCGVVVLEYSRRRVPG